MNRFAIKLLAILYIITQPVWGGFRPDSHAPIGVMSDHIHEAGEMMLSYRYMFMNMNQNYVDSQAVSTDDILVPDGEYVVSPTEMQMEMQMFGVMFAPLDQLTIMVMLPLVSNTMNHKIASSVVTFPNDLDFFEVNSYGFGDIHTLFTGAIVFLPGRNPFSGSRVGCKPPHGFYRP